MNNYLDVIIVSYNHAHFMTKLFKSLAKVQQDIPWRIHLVINKEGDGTLEVAEALISELKDQLPEVKIHRPHANLGFAGGNNIVIDWAIKHNAKYIYLLNPDTEVFPNTFNEAIKVMDSNPNIGSIQSLLLRGNTPELVNSWGNSLHFIGFGYCGGDLAPIESAPQEVKTIGYSSGAGVLFSVDVLKKVGLLDEELFAYHEDLDLGWRIWIAGYQNLLAPKSKVKHYYEFSRSVQKWELMERNRIIVLLKNYSLFNLMLLSPVIIATDVAIWAFAVRGGWIKRKFKASIWFLKPSSWRYILSGRQKIKQIRRMPDRLIFPIMTYKIEYQELNAGLAEKVANLFWEVFYNMYRFIII